MSEQCYLAIDLKSFYASVECVKRGLDPLTARLVVADAERTEKTICLAVSPALKALGISGRARLFEVYRHFGQVNLQKEIALDVDGAEITTYRAHSPHQGDFLIARPRMQVYVDVSRQIINMYNEFVSMEDVHIYSIDEVFINVTPYLKNLKLSSHAFAEEILARIYRETGITATAGIGTNLYLAKIAMDIVAKHLPPDTHGARIAELDEYSYRQQLWSHQPLTDFWRIGPGYARRLHDLAIYTMGDLARYSLTGSDKLYAAFGVNAELLIDHAWGYEPVTMSEIKNYQASSHSLSSGQVLPRPYYASEAKTIVLEMADNLAYDLVRKHLVTNQLVLTLIYETADTHITSPTSHNRQNPPAFSSRQNPPAPRSQQNPLSSHGSLNLPSFTASSDLIVRMAEQLFDQVIESPRMVRRIYLVCNHITSERKASHTPRQLTLFDDNLPDQASILRDSQRDRAILAIRQKYGKNAILKGFTFDKGATGRRRNSEIGGHRA